MWACGGCSTPRSPPGPADPGRDATPEAVNSAGLLGRTIQGKKVVSPGPTDARPGRAGETGGGRAAPAGRALAARERPGPRRRDRLGLAQGRHRPGAGLQGEPETTSIWANYRSPARVNCRNRSCSTRTPEDPPGRCCGPTWAAATVRRSGHAGAPGSGRPARRPPGRHLSRRTPGGDLQRHRDQPCRYGTARERDENGGSTSSTRTRPRTRRAEGVNPRPLGHPVECRRLRGLTLRQRDEGVRPAPRPTCTRTSCSSTRRPRTVSSPDMSFEQAVYQHRWRTARPPRLSRQAPPRSTVSNVDKLRPGISIAVGSGKVEHRGPADHGDQGATLTFDRPF